MDESGSRSGCLPDRCQNVVNSFSCRHQLFRWVSWKHVRNVNKYPRIPYSALETEVVKLPGIRIGDRIITKSSFFRLIGPNTTPSFSEIGWLLLQWCCTQRERLSNRRNRITFALMKISRKSTVRGTATEPALRPVYSDTTQLNWTQLRS